MGICLDLIQKYDCVLTRTHPRTGNLAQAEVEILRGMHMLEKSPVFPVFQQIDLDIVRDLPLRNLTYNKGLSDLPGTIDHKNAFPGGTYIRRDCFLYLAKQHILSCIKGFLS